MRQFMLTPAMGKRLIAQALVCHPHVQAAMSRGRLVIVAGTTNGYVAQEVLRATGQLDGFAREGFRRGMVTPPGVTPVSMDFTGDVVLVDGVWQRGQTVFDVGPHLGPDDVILKGANALEVARRRAAVYIGHGECGTAGAVIPAVVGRRARLIVPVGLEKRVEGDLHELAALVNSPQGQGPRLLVLPGEAFTEIEALSLLSGGTCRLVAAGGVLGAEGCVFLLVQGSQPQLAAAQKAVDAVASEPLCMA